MNFGIFCKGEARSGERSRADAFQDSPESRELLKLTTREIPTSVWKKRLNEAGQYSELQENGYWLLPFPDVSGGLPLPGRQLRGDRAKLRSFAEKGVGTIILDMVSDETELKHVRKALHCSGLF